MSITSGDGNLLGQDVDALVNTVNTQGVMGKGIALQFKKAWPSMFRDYELACKRGEVVLGRMHVWETMAIGGPRFIINFPTKSHWRGNSRIQDIESGLVNLVELIQQLEITSIAIPPLGCGNGGLNWYDVEPRILHALAPLAGSVDVRVFPPVGAPQASEQLNSENRPRLTSGRAALLALMREYRRVTFESPTLVEIQKLAYFLQCSGEPLRLAFEAHVYGPYADDLRKSLRTMEGHYVTGFGDGSAPVTEAEPVHVCPEAEESLDEYVTSHPKISQRIKEVLSEIEGFESMYGLELLSTVHWVMTHVPEAKVSADKTHAEVQKWSPRKASLFTRAHVQSAWQVVRDRIPESIAP